MYKLLIFLKKSGDEKIAEHFNDITLKHLNEVTGKEIKTAEVESNLLLETKYQKFCEAEFSSKQEMDNLFNSPAGKALSKDLEHFHEFLTIITVNYN